MLIPTDIILSFLPQSDRNADKNEEGSFYTFISSRLVRRGIASQVIYEETITQTRNYRNILNQVVPGILAKLGNLPFILAKPLAIADYFIGLDVSRIPTRRGSGSLKVVGDRPPQISLENLIEATLKLTLLHHGALKEPRLPVPLFGSDRIAYRRLQGISPGLADGDRQFWL